LAFGLRFFFGFDGGTEAAAFAAASFCSLIRLNAAMPIS
jgi:hypothetical protein|tara:strand:+ start:788 stop:904 length:117 start_codon:yes stop_codon:yes gene_type:complete